MSEEEQGQVKLEALEARVAELKSLFNDSKNQKLVEQNDVLKKEIEELKITLREAEKNLGPGFHCKVELKPKSHAPAEKTPSAKKDKKAMAQKKKQAAKENENAGKENNKSQPEQQQQQGKKKHKQPKQKQAPAPVVELPVDITRLNLKVGLITVCEPHPDADSLYVETIDLGEESGPRTIVSGLVKHVPLDEMQNRPVMILCNLKPAKMRGISSNGMVMCATSAEGKVEIVAPPSGAVPGDVITCEGYTQNPDAQLNPKKKIFEQIAPDLFTNDGCVATYKGVPLTVVGKGNCTAQTVKNGKIK